MNIQQNGLYDIYGMRHVPFWQTNLFLAGLIISLIVLTVVLVWSLVRVYKRIQQATAWAVALRRLNGLIISEKVSKEEGKQFYFALTRILKRYLSRRYKLYLQGKTDQEMVTLLDISEFPSELLPSVRTIITGCSCIKYADEQALHDQLVHDRDRAITIVQQTRRSKKEKK